MPLEPWLADRVSFAGVVYDESLSSTKFQKGLISNFEEYIRTAHSGDDLQLLSDTDGT
jgi:hypothetical protein